MLFYHLITWSRGPFHMFFAVSCPGRSFTPDCLYAGQLSFSPFRTGWFDVRLATASDKFDIKILFSGEQWDSMSTSGSYEQYGRPVIGDPRNISTAEGCMPRTAASASALYRGDGRAPIHLAPLVARVNASWLAARFTPLLGFIRSDLNPADAPSRLQ